ncbi:hypothetical protein PJL18_02885 [Paenarthrobacter nicotinovorans]|nr:hypothetical protein [Paenarthrobacter nicotinovorans]
MVALDVCSTLTTTGLDDVRVQRPLDQELDLLAFGSSLGDDGPLCFLEGADEFAADDLALGFGIADAGKSRQEAFLLVGNIEVDARGGHEVTFDLFRFAFTEQTVVYEDTGELVADSTLDKGSGNCGVDATGKAANDLGVANLLADALHLLFKDVAGGPVGAQTGALEQEVLQDMLAQNGVLDFRVPLHTVEALLIVGEGSHGGAGRRCQYFEALRCLVDGVAVAHPGVLGRRDAVENGPCIAHQERLGCAVLTQPGLGHFATQGVCHGLESVADTENGNPGLEEVGAYERCALSVDAGGSAGKDDGCRVFGQKLLGGEGVRNNFRIHICFTDAAGNQLRVLGTVVNNQHRLLGSLGCGGSSHQPRLLCRTAPAHVDKGGRGPKRALALGISHRERPVAPSNAWKPGEWLPVLLPLVRGTSSPQ